jgi:hypothetical protein
MFADMVGYAVEGRRRELVEQSRASLAADELASATELGSRLSIEDALDLARAARAAAV